MPPGSSGPGELTQLFSSQEGEEFARSRSLLFAETSAKSNHQVKDVFMAVGKTWGKHEASQAWTGPLGRGVLPCGSAPPQPFSSCSVKQRRRQPHAAGSTWTWGRAGQGQGAAGCEGATGSPRDMAPGRTGGTRPHAFSVGGEKTAGGTWMAQTKDLPRHLLHESAQGARTGSWARLSHQLSPWGRPPCWSQGPCCHQPGQDPIPS